MNLKKSILAVWAIAGTGMCAQAALSGGGVEGDPYLIGSYAELQEFAQVVNGGQYDAWAVVTNDITTTETNWTAIATNYHHYYQGTFDGAGHAISGLANEGTPLDAGLFGVVNSGGVVRNVRLKEVSFHGEGAGGIAGINRGMVSNCCVSGSVRGEGAYAGGVVGANGGTVANCHSTGTVSGGPAGEVGGVVGGNNGTVTNCHSTVSVEGGHCAGGVVGRNNNGTVANSYSLRLGAIGSYEGETDEGMLSDTAYTNAASFSGWDFDNVWVMGPRGPELRVGLPGGGTEEDPYVIYDYATLVAFAEAVNGGQDDAWGVLAADIAATGADWVAIGRFGYKGTFDGAGHTISGLANAGMPAYAGLFGEVYRGGVVRNVRLAGVAFNGEWAGGVAGQNYGTVSNCCVSGRIQGKFYAGGVAGENSGTVANCHNIGAVSGQSWGGGIAGMNSVDGSVAQCHNTGAVSDGGVVGINEGTVKNSYCPDSLGVLAICGGSGRVSGECKELGAVEYTDTWYFNGWDFNNVWAMGAEGPYLRVLGPTVAYPLWVDGVQVTDVNSGDILGDGTARYAGTKTWGTLMLTNAVITNAVAFQSGSAATAGIYAGNGFDLTISLEGSNRVENATEYGVGSGILAEGNLSLGGTGSLTAEAGSSAHGIYANGNLRIEDATVAASGLYGLCSGKNIVFTNATVTATGAFDAISANGSATFAGESRVEATATWSGQDGVFAKGGITVGEELHLIEPVGGSVSGRGVVDAAGKTAAHVLVAYFYELTIDNGSTTNQITAAGFDIDITADEPEDGEAFVQWSSNVEGLEFEDAGASPTRFTMPATNVVVEAVFRPIVISGIDEAGYTYTGSAVTPDFTVALDGVDLLVGTNYTVSWANNTNAGTAMVGVTLTNRPSGVQSNSFRIKPKPLEEGMFRLDAAQCTYDGKPQKPGFTFADGKPSVLSADDFTVTWSNNVGPGTATAVFTGKNNYTGRVEKTFEIRKGNLAFYKPAGWPAAAYLSAAREDTRATTNGYAGRTLFLHFAYENDGGGVAAKHQVEAVVKNSKGTVVSNRVWTWGRMGPGAQRPTTPIPIRVAEGGAYTLKVTVDTGNVVAEDNEKDNSATIRFYAKAPQAVTYNGNGGSPASQTDKRFRGGIYGILPQPTRKGYAFYGWWTAKSGGERVISKTMVTEAAKRTLYAHWTTVQMATFDANGGTCATASRKYTVGKTYGTLPTATRKGYAFNGWWTAATGGARVVSTTKVTETAARTLYAHWKAAKKSAKKGSISGISVAAEKAGGPQRRGAAKDGGETCVLAVETEIGAEYALQWTPELGGEWETILEWVATKEKSEVAPPMENGERIGFFRVVRREGEE